MGQKYIRRNDGTYDVVDGNQIWRSDGTVDYIDGNQIHRNGGKVDYIDGNQIWRSDGTVDYIDGNQIWRSDGSVDLISSMDSDKNNTKQDGNNHERSKQQHWIRTSTNTNIQSDNNKIAAIVAGLVLILILAMVAASIISSENAKQKRIYYQVYQTTQACEVHEPIRFTLSAYYVHSVSEGTYIIKSESDIYYYEKNSEWIRVKVENDTIHSLKYCGQITKYDREHTNWKERFN